MYLLGREGEIAGRLEFDAERDSVAMIIAEVICALCRRLRRLRVVARRLVRGRGLV
jgi:hypothetical protein